MKISTLLVCAAVEICLSNHALAQEQGSGNGGVKPVPQLRLELETKKFDDQISVLAAVRSAAAAGDPYALDLLGDALIKGWGVEKNIDEALTNYNLAVEKGNLWAASKAAAIYVKRKQYQEAKSAYEVGISVNDSSAMSGLGELYYNGNGVEKDLNKSINYFRNSVNNGNLWSNKNLARAIIENDPSKVNEALPILKKAVEIGDISALETIGDIYSTERFGLRNRDLAIKYYGDAVGRGDLWAAAKLASVKVKQPGASLSEIKSIFELGVSTGDTSAFIGLGDLYSDGKLVKKDIEEAVRYYTKALEAGNLWAASKLGTAYRMLPDQSVPAEIVLSTYEKGTQVDDSAAFVGLGDLYADAKLFPTDPLKAKSYYETALTLGSGVAAGKLGKLFSLGTGPEMPPAKSIEYFELGAASGDTYSMLSLGDAYKIGRYVKLNLETSAGYYLKAFESGASDGMAKAGSALLNGSGRVQDRGLELLKEAKAKGLPGATVALSNAYLYGKGVTQNPSEAISILESSPLSDPYPKLRLAELQATGFGTKISRRRALAVSTVDAVLPQLPEQRRAIERAYITGAAATSSNEFRDLYEIYRNLDRAAKAEVAGRIGWANLNSYVYILQAELAAAGYYEGPLNGLLTRGTINSFNRMCKEIQWPNFRDGPLSDQGRAHFQYFIRSLST